MSLRGDLFVNFYGLEKAELLKCLNIPVSEHFWLVNMLKAPEQCLNQHGSLFVVFFDDLITTQVQKFCHSNM